MNAFVFIRDTLDGPAKQALEHSGPERPLQRPLLIVANGLSEVRY
jgi:hypothetical protein